MDSGFNKASNTGKHFILHVCVFSSHHTHNTTQNHQRHDIFLTNKSYSCQVNILFILIYDVEWIVFQTQSFLKG